MSTEAIEQTEPLGGVTTPIGTQKLPLSRPVKLTEVHDLSEFDCGNPALNEYLVKGLSNQKRNNAVIYVACLKDNMKVKAFYTLSNGSVVRSTLPKKLISQSPDNCPVTILGRIGVDNQYAGMGIGTDLLKDAVEKAYLVSQAVGSKGLLVHAKNPRVADFYRKNGFVPCPVSELTLVLSFC